MKKHYNLPLMLILMVFLISPLWSYSTGDSVEKQNIPKIVQSKVTDSFILPNATLTKDAKIRTSENSHKGSNVNTNTPQNSALHSAKKTGQEVDQPKEVWKGYEGWEGNPDSLDVYIDTTWTDKEKDSCRAAMARWNAAGCKPKFRETSNADDAEITITQGNPGAGNAGLWEGEPQTGKLTSSTITVAKNSSPGLVETLTHELGHAIGLNDTDETANPGDVMKGKGSSNGTNGNLSKHDSTEMRLAAASITDIAEDPPEHKNVSFPEQASVPGEFTDLSFDLEDYYPPETILIVQPIEDPLLFVEYAFLEGDQLWVGVFSDPLHGSGTVYFDITLIPPDGDPYNFWGIYYLNINPVPPTIFSCPFEVVQTEGLVHVNWTDFHDYPHPNPLRSQLLVDGNSLYKVKPDGDYTIQLSPGTHSLELFVDDYQVNSASYTMDIVVEATIPPWEEPFEDYPLGSDIVGQSGWEFWFGGTYSPSARVTSEQVHSGLNALQILGKPDMTGDDLVYQFAGCTSGIWEFTAQQYIPEEAAGGTSYLVLLNQYGYTLEECNWSTQIKSDSDLGIIESEGDGGTLPLIKGEWAEISVVIDLDNDEQTISYNGEVLSNKSWTLGIPQAESGSLNIAAINLFAGDLSSDPVYYDDLSLMPYVPQAGGGMLKVGDWLESEEWHRWIGNDEDETKVEFYPDLNDGILSVDFYYSIAGTGEWILFDSDDNGVTGLAPGPLPAGTDEMDGWSGYLDHAFLPDVNVELDFRADVFYVDSFFDVFTDLSVEWDITPPSAVSTNLFDYYITDDPYILLEVFPGSANIAYLEIETGPKLPYFEKGVPPAYQPGNMDCGPTALAACLKYFESHGYPNICGGLSLADLIEQLKDYCETDPENGTWDNKLESGALRWINEHGDGMTVRRTGFNWKEMRNELERGQDVITLFQWEDADGLHGHFMTFNSVSNIPEPDGRVKIDFMDPWTGEIIDGYINPQTNEVSGFTDSQGNVFPPDGSWVCSNVIICPAEPSISPGTGTVIPWPIPEPYPIPLDTPGLYWIRIQIIDDDGNKSRLDYPIEVISQVEPGVDDLFLKIGDWLVAEPWNDWIGGMNAESSIELLASDPDHLIQKVSFFYSMDGGQEFIEFCTDTDGSQPALSTYGEAGDGDGWACQFPHEMLPALDMELFFRAELTLSNGEVMIAENSTVFDPTPPDEVIINLEDWLIFEDDQILLQVDPGNCIDLDRVWFDLIPKVDSFAKGIPPISQQPHSTTHCSPTASAACLKYFESKGDSTLAGGLNDYGLVEALAGLMKTNQGKNGTYISDIANGLKTWTKNHGDNYSVRKLPYNWKTMRNELERCQDVIPSIFWPGGGGHSMTFNSIVNNPNADGTITVDFMDPWTGQIEWGHINPASGIVTQLSGAGGGGSGEMGPMIIVCPKDPNALPGNGQIIPGPFPNPGIIIPVPNPGLYFLRIIFIDNSMHVARTDLVLKRESTMDWGDAPDDTTTFSYPTLAMNNGASHFIDGLTFLGSLIDGEPDGQPNINAAGDDLNNLADEDGVSFGQIITGSPAQITVTTSVAGYLQGWMDFNGDGDWNDANEQIFMDEYIHFSSTVCLNYMVPVDAKEGNTYARFRFATFPGLSYFGSADNGEVEDYMVSIIHDQGIKWQQEPCPENTGLHCHDYTNDGVYLYTVIADDWLCQGGLVTDIHWWGNYEDPGSGIEYFHLSIHNSDPTSCLPVANEIWGMDVTMDMVNETNTGMLNREDNFIYSYDYLLDIPFDQVAGETYWLDICAYSVNPNNPSVWRWQESDRSTVPILCPAAYKDISNTWISYSWTTPQPTRYSDMAFVITSMDDPPDNFDFGDAPDDTISFMYPTLLASNGARHIIDGITYLGNSIDPELDGQPNVPATGDDLANVDDEDGVVFRDPLVCGKSTTIKVKASVDGILNVWLDIDRNGSWANAGEHVFVNTNLTAGWNTLILNLPASAIVGRSYMRFRFDSQGGLNYYGLAENGEVEDYRVKILPEGYGFIPTPIPHTIMLPLDLTTTGITLLPNDVIAVFYDDGSDGVELCGGAQVWDGANNQVLLAYGDDATTTPKDGFVAGEVFVWKVYHSATGNDEYVSVVYDPDMPQSDGKFTPYGISGLTAMSGLSVTATASPYSVCAGDLVQLNVTVSGGSGSYAYSWTSVPVGFTSNIKNPSDTPSQDITYFVNVSSGSATASSSVDVAVQAEPVVNAGPNATICETDGVVPSATAVNYNMIVWTSLGDGAFNDPNLVNPTYSPGFVDITGGSVNLSVVAAPISPCAVSASDVMTVTIVKQTTASAGDDANVCPGSNYTLSGSATNYSSVLWGSGGDGTFDDASDLGATYTPGSDDIQQGFVTLCLQAYPKSPCTVGAIDCLTIYIREEQSVYLFEGWSGLSSYLTPYNSSDNYDLFSPLFGNLTLAYNFEGAFWSGNTNTLNWVDTSGYVVKLAADDEMIFCGDEISDKVLKLKKGWNLIPVLSKGDVDITQVFDTIAVDFKVVLEVAGYNVFWPEYFINDIGAMESGKSYFAFMNSAGTIDFSNASTKTGVIAQHEFVENSPWGLTTTSPGGHVFAFAPDALLKFKTGDLVGGFTSSGQCSGIAEFNGNSLALVLNGDDIYTTQRDGFENDELITYKVFRPETDEVFDLEVEYVSELDASGRFHSFGMSAISQVKLSLVGIDSYGMSDIRIYPNPSHGMFNLEGINSETQIHIYNGYGNEIYTQTTFNSTIINLTDHPKGVYLIKLQTLNGTYYQKVIIN